MAIAATAEPSYVAGSSPLIWQDTFDSVTTDAAMLQKYTTLSAAYMHLDATGGVNGTGAARIDWKAATTCSDDSRILEKDFKAPANDVYVQYSVRYTPQFAFDWKGRSPCHGNTKTLFLLWASSGSRFDFLSQNHALVVGADNAPLVKQNVGTAVTDDMLGDGSWHRVTLHVRQSSTATTADGLIEGWIDGVQRWSLPNVASGSTGGWRALQLPSTFVKGSPLTQSEWLDGFTVWGPGATVASAPAPAPATITNPGTVTDLAVASIADTTASLTFTQVTDGTGLPASYDIRYAVAPMSWGTASDVTRGTCSTPLAGTAIGAKLTCTINGLVPSTAYNFQIVAFRGTLGVSAVFGPLSPVLAASTTATGTSSTVPAAIVESPGSVSDTVKQTTQFSATVKDANGNVINGATVTWTSGNTAVAVVNSNGLVTAVGAGSTTIRATDGTVSASASIAVSTPTTVGTPASVTVSPSVASDTVKQTTQFAASVNDASGNVISGATVTWTSGNTAVATVSASGLVTAVGAGTAAITATSGLYSGSALLTVTAPTAPAPAPAPSSTEPLPNFGTMVWQDNFNQASSDATLLAPYVTMGNETGIHYDATGGLGGSAAMRIDWKQATSCTDDGHLVERDFSAPGELYVQFNVRYQPGFLFDWTKGGGAISCSGNAKKLFLVWGGSGRMDFIAENHHLVLYDDNIGYASGLQNANGEFTPEMFGDGNWHRVTLHFKQSSNSSTADGFRYGWIDGVLHWNYPAVATVSSGGFIAFKTPATFNQGSPVAQSEWMDGLTVWHP